MIKDIESCADSISISVNKYYTSKVIVKSYTVYNIYDGTK
jgi:hypothetical protein